MSLIDNLLSSGGSQVVSQFASHFGVTADQATSALSTLVPALAGGLQEKLAANEGAPSDLSKMIMGGNLSSFAEDPASLTSQGAVEQGNSLLHQIFGGADLSHLASMAAEKTGISSSIVSNMLPVIMAALGGFLSKKVAGGETSLNDALGAITGGGGILGALKSFAHKITG
jgi:hypothetical protein